MLDFGRYIAAPYCATLLLAEFGAEVIRVEKLDGSEDRFVAPVGADGEGALFLQINRNKKCITLNPMKPEGQEVMRRLVMTADVVVANLPPQTLAAMKLDYESLKAIKPDIILTSATAFDGPGPWSDRVGQVMSGAVYMTGTGNPPYRAAGHPLFIRWAKLMGEDHWLTDPRFADDPKRGENGPVISERMARWCAERSSQEALDTLGAAMIPEGPVLSPQQALDHPHIRAAGFLQDVDYPGLPKPAPLARAAVRLPETPGEIVTRPPTLGEHTDMVLVELGYDAAAIAALLEKRIV